MDRHAQQKALLEIGESGQQNIKNANILIVGMGALGSVVAELLCRAGVGRLTVMDFDIVEETNLQRQALYTTEDIGHPKVNIAKKHLRAIDPTTEIIPENRALSSTEDLSTYTIIIDGTDNLQTRFLLNDLAGQSKKPVVYAMASQTHGQVLICDVDDPCFSCLYQDKKANDTCDQGVLPTLTHAIATMQATAVIRHLVGKPAKGMIAFDGWNMTTKTIATTKKIGCPRCNGNYEYIEQPFTMGFCQGTRRIHARPNKPIVLHLDALRGERLETYPNAVRIKIGDGFALVHRHGLLEFDNVANSEAQQFVERILKEVRE